MSKAEQAVRFGKAIARWIAAGRPRRSDERIRELEAICSRCQHYEQVKPEVGNCKICGCPIRTGGWRNKLLWATESCPDEPPRWPAEVEPTEDQIEAVNKNSEQFSKTWAHGMKRVTSENRVLQIKKTTSGGDERQIEYRSPRVAADDQQEAVQKPVKVVPADDPLKVFDRLGRPCSDALRGILGGGAAFLVGGGPSLEELDVAAFGERGVYSMAINNVAGWVRTSAFVCGDDVEKFHHGIWFDATMDKFAPTRRLKHRVRAKLEDGRFVQTAFMGRQCPRTWGFSLDRHWEPAAFLTRESATWGRQEPEEQKNYFSLFLGLRLLHFLGAERVYLAGVDFYMDGENKYAFGQERTVKAIRMNNHKYRMAAEMCQELAPHLAAAGFEVYNTNQQSRCRAWPYVPFDEAVEDCRGMVPAGEFDLSGWYEKDDNE